MRLTRSHVLRTLVALATLLALPIVAGAQTVSNPTPLPDCMSNTAFFNPALPASMNLPPGFTASVFASGLNMPTGIAFLGNSVQFKVYVWD
jgi:glucose/arabinose dehydrogenase